MEEGKDIADTVEEELAQKYVKETAVLASNKAGKDVPVEVTEEVPSSGRADTNVVANGGASASKD